MVLLIGLLIYDLIELLPDLAMRGFVLLKDHLQPFVDGSLSVCIDHSEDLLTDLDHSSVGGLWRLLARRQDGDKQGQH